MTPARSFLLALTALAGTALAGDDGCLCHRVEAFGSPPLGIDEATGKDLRNYPPHRSADILHVRLDLEVRDMNVPRLTGRETLRLAAFTHGLEDLRLDARAMAISGVTCDGHPVTHTYADDVLTVTFNPPLAAGAEAVVVIDYQLNDPPLGLIWTPESPAWPGRAAQIHSQGQPETNSYWFPCHDSPNERMTTELAVTVPAGYLVSSNGRLLAREKKILTSESRSGSTEMGAYERFHWLQDKPHVAYLVSLIVGKFDVVDLAESGTPCPVYVPPGRAADARATFGRTPRMIEVFERRLDEPYPWDRYAQLVVWNFGSGGMENTGATTLYDTAVIAQSDLDDHDLDGLIAHELAHQWFGDLVTCNSWEHIWINEGLATFMNELWMEERDGKAAYYAQFRRSFDSLIKDDKAEAPAAVGMVSKVYEHPWKAFRRPANAYSKGSSILHMLRVRLGDENFFGGLATYIDRRKLRTAETHDLRKAFEDVSGESLEQFFAQWCYRPGLPHLTITPEWDEAAKTLTVTVEQTQTIDADNPAFEFDLPIEVGGDAGSATRGVMHVDARTSTANFSFPRNPSYFAVDPEMAVLANLVINHEEQAWLAQLRLAPGAPSRVQAIRGLAKPGSADATLTLRKLAADTAADAWVRTEAVKALVARQADIDVRSLFTSVLDRWEVREALTTGITDLALREEPALSATAKRDIAAKLNGRAGSDPSVKVRAAAVRGLGKLKSVDHRDAVACALTTDSQHDLLRQAGLEALASLDEHAGLAEAVRLAGPGVNTRTRPIAVETIAKLGHHDTTAAVAALAPLLEDREMRTRQAAGKALMDLGDKSGAEHLDRVARSARAREYRIQLEGWHKELNAKP